MDYRKGQLSIKRCRSFFGQYKCIFETKKGVWLGYTCDSEIYDHFNIDPDHLYWYGVTSTLRNSRELTRRAWRAAYHIAKAGKFYKDE